MSIAQFMIFFGIVLLILGLVISIRPLGHVLGSRVTLGRVIGVDEYEFNNPAVYRYWVPIVEYEVDGKRHKFKGVVGRKWTEYSLGDRVEVIYQPRHPEWGRLNLFEEIWPWYAILFPIGVVVTTVGLFLLPGSRARGGIASKRKREVEIWDADGLGTS